MLLKSGLRGLFTKQLARSNTGHEFKSHTFLILAVVTSETHQELPSSGKGNRL